MRDYIIIGVLAFSICANIFAVVKLNRAYDKVADIFCVEAK